MTTGFEAHYNYTTVVDPDLLCPWCSDPLQNPNALSECDHTFCRKCIDDFRSTQQHDSERFFKDDRSETDSVIEARLDAKASVKTGTESIITCPICERESSGFQPNPLIKSHVDSLFVKCIHCQTSMPRLHFAQHWTSECPTRFVTCETCHKIVIRTEWEAHEKECENARNGPIKSENHWEEARTKLMGQVRFEDEMDLPVPRPREPTVQPRETRPTTHENGLPTPPISEKSAEVSNRFTYLENGRELRPGVIFEYFQGEWEALPDFDKLQLSNAGIMSTFTINENTEENILDKIESERGGLLDPGNFAVRFSAYVIIPHAGQYTFYLTSNDGSALYIHGTKVVDNDGQHYSKEAEGRIDLTAGPHPVTVLFFHKSGKRLESYRSGPFLSVAYYCPGHYWVFDNNTKQVLTREQLAYDYEDLRIRKLLNLNEKEIPKSIDLAPSANQLKVQLDVANATIRSLEQVIQQSTEITDVKIARLQQQLQHEQEQILAVKRVLHANRIFVDSTSSSGTVKQHNRGQTVSVYMDAQSEIDVNFDEDAEIADLLAQDMLMKHLGEVERIKQMYFFSIALSIKMNIQLLGRTLPPELSVQRLYEEIVIDRKVSLKNWANEVSLYLGTRTK